MKSMNTIKKTVFATFLALNFSLYTLVAQNDTMYVMKSGAVVGKYNVNNQIDSVIFYNPTTGSSPSVTDFDGNVYNTVTLGAQVWMKENLKTTHYSDGTAIPLKQGYPSWDALTTISKAYCWYNDDITYKDKYGALYTWAAAMNGESSSTTSPSGIQGACPTGWHLPSEAEWTQMENYLADNGYNYDGTTGGGKAKIAKSLASASGWTISSLKGSVGNTDYPEYRNKSDFTALPVGYRYHVGGNFGGNSEDGYWWTTAEFSTTKAYVRNIFYLSENISRENYFKEEGFSVRCVRN